MGVQLRGGRVLGGAVQVFEVMGAHLGCPPFLRFIMAGMGPRLWCPSSPELGDIRVQVQPCLLVG